MACSSYDGSYDLYIKTVALTSACPIRRIQGYLKCSCVPTLESGFMDFIKTYLTFSFPDFAAQRSMTVTSGTDETLPNFATHVSPWGSQALSRRRSSLRTERSRTSVKQCFIIFQRFGDHGVLMNAVHENVDGNTSPKRTSHLYPMTNHSASSLLSSILIGLETLGDSKNHDATPLSVPTLSTTSGMRGSGYDASDALSARLRIDIKGSQWWVAYLGHIHFFKLCQIVIDKYALCLSLRRFRGTGIR